MSAATSRAKRDRAATRQQRKATSKSRGKELMEKLEHAGRNLDNQPQTRYVQNTVEAGVFRARNVRVLRLLLLVLVCARIERCTAINSAPGQAEP